MKDQGWEGRGQVMGARLGWAAAAFAAYVIMGGVAYGVTGSSQSVAGTWHGTSYDSTYDIPGTLDATFSVQTSSTFTGTIDAVYPEPNPPETCTVSAGKVAPDGAVTMNVICRAPGYPAPEAATIDATLSANGTTMSGTFRGPNHDAGTFTLTKQSA
jgi:hypothetical protein